MKKILLIALVLVMGLSGYGQYIHSWRQEGVVKNSLEFVDRYGSIDEYNFQHQIDIPGAYQTFFTDAKFAYIRFVFSHLMYLNICGGTIKMSGTATDIILTIQDCSIKTENGIKNYPVVVRAIVDKDRRMKKVTITGRGDQLLPFFRSFWNIDRMGRVDLGKGMKKTVYSWDDQITFDWTKPKAEIRIRRHGDLDNYKTRFVDKKQ